MIQTTEKLLQILDGQNKDYYNQISLGLIPGVSYVAKFGENPDIDTDTVPEDIWEFGGEYIFSTTDDIDTMSSSSANDTEPILVIGLDENWNEVQQTIVLTGQTKVTLGTPLIRVYRMVNIGTSDLEGIVYCYVDGDITDGVPDAGADVRAIIDNGNNQTLMCIYTVPAGKTGLFTQGYVAMARPQTSVARMSWKARPFGSVFQVKSRISIDSSSSSSWQYRYVPAVALPEKTDIIITCETISANNTGISGGFEVILFDNEMYGL